MKKNKPLVEHRRRIQTTSALQLLWTPLHCVVYPYVYVFCTWHSDQSYVAANISWMGILEERLVFFFFFFFWYLFGTSTFNETSYEKIFEKNLCAWDITSYCHDSKVCWMAALAMHHRQSRLTLPILESLLVRWKSCWGSCLSFSRCWI